VFAFIVVHHAQDNLSASVTRLAELLRTPRFTQRENAIDHWREVA
jgi:hypothetical protein